MAPEQSDEPRAAYALRAVDRVCDILDILANASEGVSLTEVTEGTDLPKSSAFRYLAALEARRYVAREPETGLYRLGLAFRPQNTRLVDLLTEIARPAVDRLRDELGETVNVGVLDGDSILHTVVAESPHMMRLAARVDERGFVHSTALGKAICATLPEARVRAILASSGMPALTGSTIVTPDAYIAELDRVRVNGYGVDDAENQLAGRCVAVAIPDIGLPAGISVSAPADRLAPDQLEGVAAELRKLARALSKKLRAESARQPLVSV
jgi:IclR family acetate operon transcriptional repressor